MRARDIPASPAIFKARPMVRYERAAMHVPQFVAAGMKGTDENARDSHRDGPLMAAKAVIAAGEFRLVRSLDIEAVEYDAQPGIEGRYLQNVTTLYVTDSHIVVEVNGTRGARRNMRYLDTAFGKYEHLGV